MNQSKTKTYVMVYQYNKEKQAGHTGYIPIDEFKKYITKEEK